MVIMGLIEPYEIVRLMRIASVALASIVLDCWSTVVLEAKPTSRPVVAPASGGIVDIYDGITGILVGSGDARSQADVLALSLIHI